MIRDFGELCIADSLKEVYFSPGLYVVLSRRYKRKAIKRSFPSTTSDESRGILRLRLSLSPSFFHSRLSSRIACTPPRRTSYSPRPAQAWYVHLRFYSINWNCNSSRKVEGFSSTVPGMCARVYTGWSENEGAPRPRFNEKIDDFLLVVIHQLLASCHRTTTICITIISHMTSRN